MVAGQFDGTYLLAIDPKGHVPGEVYDPAVDGPLTAPNFGRHYRYNEVSLYGEDSIRLTNRFTLTLGLRWEYFGVLHSPNAEPLSMPTSTSTRRDSPSPSILRRPYMTRSATDGSRVRTTSSIRTGITLGHAWTCLGRFWQRRHRDPSRIRNSSMTRTLEMLLVQRYPKCAE